MPTRPVDEVIDLRSTLPEHVRQVASELQETLPRLRTMLGYVETKTFRELPVVEQRLILDQLESLQDYAKTVALRYCMHLTGQ